jgi:hypothetical protein
MKTKTKTIERFPYRLIITYPAIHYSAPEDECLFNAVGRISDGAGIGFGLRDHEWAFKTKAEANLAANKVKALQLCEVDIRIDKHK